MAHKVISCLSDKNKAKSFASSNILKSNNQLQKKTMNLSEELNSYKQDRKLLEADVYQYNALSDGKKRVYTNEDELLEYGNKGILNPDKVSYYDLFINGVLQPKTNYEIFEGILILKTEDIPINGSPIVIIFVTFREERVSNLNSVISKGNIPSGNILSGPTTDLDITVNNNHQCCLRIEKNIISGPTSIYSGSSGTWNISFKISNIESFQINNIVLIDTILLDFISNSKNLSCSQGSITKNGNILTWTIGTLNAGESAYASFSIEGYFKGYGISYISRSFATGNSLIGVIKSDIASGEEIQVLKSLDIVKTITSGPVMINLGKTYQWRVEIKVSNLSDFNIADILVKDVLFIERINKINIISKSAGKISIVNNEIRWEISILDRFDSAYLVVDIVGAFSIIGERNLSSTSVICIFPVKVFAGPSKDIAIMVLPTKNTVKKQLLLQKSIANKSSIAFLKKYNKWSFSLKITNLTDRIMKDVIVTDHILFDKFETINNISLSSGDISISHNFITWTIDQLLPGESKTAFFEVFGLFETTGLRSIDRAIALSKDPNFNNCIISDIVSGKSIRVINNFENSCIIADKVYSQCKKRSCFEKICLEIGSQNFKKIIFRQGFIVKNTLIISKIKGRPNFKRVQFTLRIPFEVVLESDNIIKGYLPDLPNDIVLFMPESIDEFSYDIVVETSSRLLKEPIIINNQIHFSVGVFAVIKAVGKVQLFIPSYGPGLVPIHSESYAENMDFKFYKPKYSTLVPSLKNNNQNCHSLFGNLNIEKYILSGPTVVNSNDNNTWRIEIRVNNNGYGPISNVIVTDTLFLDKLNCVNIIGVTKGTVSIQDNKIIWNIGTINSSTVDVLLAEISGSFDYKDSQTINAKSFQYNTISDGIKKEYSDADRIEIPDNMEIPDPNEVSYYNLYINGVLQPEANYTVEKGLLTLTTIDAPPKGAHITLEYIIARDRENQLLKAETYQYNILGANKKLYTNSDELVMYGNKGILNPKLTSYQILFVNGVSQPSINYSINKGTLLLKTEDFPLENSPISIQFVSLYK